MRSCAGSSRHRPRPGPRPSRRWCCCIRTGSRRGLRHSGSRSTWQRCSSSATCSTSSAGSGRVRALCAVPTWSSSGRWPNASRRPPPCGPARNASGRLPNRRTTRSSPRALASVTPSSPSGEQSPPKRVNPGARQRHDAAKHRGTGKSVITAGGPGDLAGTKLDQQGGHRGNARGAVRRREDVAPWSPSPCSPGLPVPRLFIFDTAVLSTGRPSIIT
jgi:hypothetical protein